MLSHPLLYSGDLLRNRRPDNPLRVKKVQLGSLKECRFGEVTMAISI